MIWPDGPFNDILLQVSGRLLETANWSLLRQVPRGGRSL
jgi:hypothetical protein